MKKLLFISCFSLLGCAGGLQQAQLDKSLMRAEQATQECAMGSMEPQILTAWELVRAKSQSCPNFSVKNRTQEQSIALNRCHYSLVKNYVEPVTRNKKAFGTYDKAMKALSADFANGRLDTATANVRSQRDFNAYLIQEISFYKYAQCGNQALNQYVMPVYSNKGLLVDFMARKAEIGLKVDQKKLSLEEADIELQKAYAVLLNNEQQMNSAQQAQARAAWNQSLQSYASVMAAENNRPAPAHMLMPTTTKTRCYRIGNQTDCTTVR